jgi:predicted permease
MRNMGRDFRYALRRLRATPLFTTFAVVTLAVGIGSTTAIYSVIYAVLLRPADIPNLDRVVHVRHVPIGSGPMMSISWPDYEDLRRFQTSFDRIAAVVDYGGSVTAVGRARQALGAAVSSGYFEVMGLQPVAGRLLQPADDPADAPLAVCISERLWERLFDSEPSAIGQTMKIDGRAFTVVGVVPGGYRGSRINAAILTTDFWVSLEPFVVATSETLTLLPDREDRTSRTLSVVARTRPDTSMADAQADVRRVAALLDRTVPLPSTGRSVYQRSRQWAAIPARHVGLAEQPVVWGLALTAMAGVGLVLLIACTNLANLLLARSAARRHEFAVRRALGASRWRLVRESMADSGVVAVAGGAAGVLIAYGLVNWLSRDIVMSARAVVSVAPRLDPVVLALAAGSTLASLLVFGAAPALTALRADVRAALAGAGSTGAVPRWRGRRWVIAGQVTVSVVLVLLAALSARQATEMTRADAGIGLDRLAIVSTTSSSQDAPARVQTLLQEVSRQIGAQPGVEAAALASGLPIGQSPGGGAWRTDRNAGMRVEFVAATPSVFETLAVPIVRGRGFDARDDAAGRPVAVISQSVADRLFEDQDPVGQSFQFQRTHFFGQPEPEVVTLTAIGIADDQGDRATARTTFAVYRPLTQHHERNLWVLARTSADPARLLPSMRETMGRVAPEIAVSAAGTGLQIAKPELLFFGVTAGLSAILGLIALVLALAGLFGVLAHIVARRTREIGVRIALGAETPQIIRLVLREGMSPVLLGIGVGTAFGVLARLATRPMFLAPLPAVDIWALVLVPIPMLLAGLLACYLPARRAALVDPNVALRDL